MQFVEWTNSKQSEKQAVVPEVQAERYPTQQQHIKIPTATTTNLDKKTKKIIFVTAQVAQQLQQRKNSLDNWKIVKQQPIHNSNYKELEKGNTKIGETTTGAKNISNKTANAPTTNSQRPKKMEHSYMSRSAQVADCGLPPARTILVHRAPQCPSCHTHGNDEDEVEDENKARIPDYNEIAAKEAMNECARIAKYVKNQNPDDEDWEERIPKHNWNQMQKNLFDKVAEILNNDYLGRLVHQGRPHEPMQRRILVDTSASRLRKTLTEVFWDVRLTQWLHAILMEYLPSTYMAGYLDILQTLKGKVPQLLDKMLFGRPLSFSQELLAPVMKQRWEPTVCPKTHNKLPNTVVIVIPPHFGLGKVSKRQHRWYQQFSSFAELILITMPANKSFINRQPVEQIAEQVVSLTRVKVQELRNEDPTRNIVLIGFNAGAAMALQVAMSQIVSCVICMGFAYNTLNGVRGAPDDRILDLKVPVLFIIGQNSARSSPEELESLRERMMIETALVVVGCGDDVLRVPRSRKRLENVTQAMVDFMIIDELYEYIKRTLENPPGLRAPIPITGVISRVGKGANHGNSVAADAATGTGVDAKSTVVPRKRKQQEVNPNQIDETPKKFIGTHAKSCETLKKIKNIKFPTESYIIKRKVGRPRIRPLASIPTTAAADVSSSVKPSNIQPKAKLSNFLASDDLTEVMTSILNDDSNDNTNIINTNALQSSTSGKQMTSYELVAEPSKKVSPAKPITLSSSPMGSKIKLIPSNQFVQIKPNGTNNFQTSSKFITFKSSNQTPTVLNAKQLTGLTNKLGTQTNNQLPKIVTLKASNVAGQPKYTIVKGTTGGPRLQLSSNVINTPVTTTPTTTTTATTVKSDVDLSNILHMPIVFADQEGFITDNVTDTEVAAPITVPNSKPNLGKYIISQSIISPPNTQLSSNTVNTKNQSTLKINNMTYVVNKSATNVNKNIVFLNGSTLKPNMSNVIGRVTGSSSLSGTTSTGQPIKYTKFVLGNTSGQIVPINVSKPFNLQTNTPGVISKLKIIKAPLNVNSVTNTGTAVRNVILNKLPSHLNSQLLTNNRQHITVVPLAQNTTYATSTTATNEDNNITKILNLDSLEEFDAMQTDEPIA